MAIVQLNTLTTAVKTAYELDPDVNRLTDVLKAKLDGISSGATANSPDATLLARANHTGTQAISTITGLSAALAAVGTPVFLPTAYGGTAGTGLTGIVQAANTSAINQAIVAADAANGRVDLSGTWEIAGEILCAGSNYVIGGSSGKIVQFTAGVNILNMANTTYVRVADLELAYNASQITGGDPTATDAYVAAIRFTGTNRYCQLANIKTTQAWVGLGLSGTNVSHTFANITVVATTASSWPFVAKIGADNCTFVNCTAVSNTTASTIPGALFLSGTRNSECVQFRAEKLVCLRALLLSSAANANFEHLTLDTITPTQAAGYASLIHLNGGAATTASFETVRISGTILDKTTGSVDFARVFGGGATGVGGGYIRVRGCEVSNTTKTGVVQFDLVGGTSSAAPLNLFVEMEDVRLDVATATPHRIDNICPVSLDAASVSLNGPVRAYNQTVGDAVGGYVTWADAGATLYPEVHGPWQRWNAPLTANRSITISNRIGPTYGTGPLNAPVVPRGSRMHISRTSLATGAFNLTVLDWDGSTIGTLAVGQTGDFVIDETGGWSGYGRGTF